MALVATANGEDPVPLTPRIVEVSGLQEEERKSIHGTYWRN